MSRVSRESAPAGAMLVARWRATMPDHVAALEWSPDGRLVAALSVDGHLRLLEAGSGTVCAAVAAHAMGATSMAWHPKGTMLATGGQDGHVHAWDPATGDSRATLPAGAAWVERVRWSPNGRWLAAAAGRRVRLWGRALEHLRDCEGHESTVSDLAWNPRGVMLAATGYGGVWLWHPDEPAPRTRYEWKGSVLVAAWSPDGRMLATGDQDATVHFWYADSGRDLQMSGYPVKVRELAWDASSRLLATGGGREVAVWDCSGRGPEGTDPILLPGHEVPVAGVAFQPDGPLLASVARDGRLVVWRPRATRKLVGAAAFSEGLCAVAWSPDGRAVAVGGIEGGVAVVPVGG